MATRRVPAGIGLGLLLLAAGCGDGDGTKTYPVEGRVVFKGGDVSKLAGYGVYFESVGEPKVTGGGEVEADGDFAVSCHVAGKDRAGLPAGEYRVSVSPPREGGRRGGLIHPKYASLDKSGLKVTVASGTNSPTLEVEGGK